jgi:hypothetical protein
MSGNTPSIIPSCAPFAPTNMIPYELTVDEESTFAFPPDHASDASPPSYTSENGPATHFTPCKEDEEPKHHDTRPELGWASPLLRAAAVILVGGLFIVLFSLLAISIGMLVLAATKTTTTITNNRDAVETWSKVFDRLYPTSRYDALPTVAFWWDRV